jgi:transcriptional regulator of acetoin/glycerol metabolism
MNRSDDDETLKTDDDFFEVMGGTLVVLSGSGKAPGAPMPIGTEPIIVGRGEHCHVSVPDARMSTSHFSLVATPDGVSITDRESLNGTSINQVRLKSGNSAYSMKGGRIHAGDTWFEIQVTGREQVPISGAVACGPLVGHSFVMRELYAKITRVAPTPLSVLITGETGSGKELVAQAIHETSGRRGKMVTIDCGAIPPPLVESHLFGHEKGAFTGASAPRRSPFLEARGGTVFIDELDSLPMDLQPKLLRVIEARQIQAVGATRWEPIDVRVVAASRRDLHAEMNAGRFRNDLYFRFAQRRIEVPPLREHPEDIADLVALFLAVREV